MNKFPLLAVAAAALLFSISADGAGSVGSWSQVVEKRQTQKNVGQHAASQGHRRGSPWSPDPDELLGPYEDEAPPRDTEAYFLTPNNTAVTVQVGSTAALRCQVFNVGEHETVSWIRHRDHHLITLGSTTHSSDERFQVTYDQNTKDWTLHIRFTQPRDAGIYECQLNAHPPIGVHTKLNVIEAVATIAGGPEMYIQVGSAVHLQCSIERYTEPPTYVFWYQNNRMVNYDDRSQFSVLYDGGGLSELRLGSASASDSGNYSCVPSNAQTASIVIHVITGEAPAAMQSASSSHYYHHLDIALLSLALHVLSRLGLPQRLDRR